VIGKWVARIEVRPLQRAFAGIFGVEDFHTHLRLAWLEHYAPAARGRFCELGCGTGVACIEFLLRHPDATAVGFEASSSALEIGSGLAHKLGLEGRFAVFRHDLAGGVPDLVQQADYVLLLDVLEHLRKPDDLSAAIVGRLSRGARVLVSVPTRLYPRIFGRAYHEHVGHCHDGFRLDELDGLFAGLERVRYRYSTGPLTWPGAALYYRLQTWSDGERPHMSLTRLARWLVVMFAMPFRFLDFWNGKNVSCSLFAEYVKR